jgi:hypothetical protein
MLYLWGRRSCGVTVGVTGGRNSRVCGDVGGGAHGRTVRELGVGIAGRSRRGGWLGSRIVCGRSRGGLQTVVGTVVGGWLVGRIACGCSLGCSANGLQLLATTMSVSSLSSSSARIWKGLLCRVRRWFTMGNCQMVFGAVMVLDNAMVTLGGAAIATLRGVTGITLRDVGSEGGALGGPAMMVVSCQMALRCFSLAVVVVGIAHSSCCNRLAAACKVMSCSDVVGSWQWLGYKHHVSEKRKRWVAGM